MITIEQAIKIALERNNQYNAYQEYKDAFMFFIDDGVIREGGGDNGVIIEKETGNILRWNQYFMDENREITEIGDVIRI